MIWCINFGNVLSGKRHWVQHPKKRHRDTRVGAIPTTIQTRVEAFPYNTMKHSRQTIHHPSILRKWEMATLRWNRKSPLGSCVPYKLSGGWKLHIAVLKKWRWGSWALTRTSRKAELLREKLKSCLTGQYTNSVTWLDWSRKEFTKIKEIKLKVPLQDSGNNQHKFRLETGLRGGKKEEHDKHKA